MQLFNDANKHNNAYLSSSTTNTLTGVAKLTDKDNIKLDGKSLRSSRTRLNKALNRYCTSTVPKHLTSSSSTFLSQSGKNILDKIKPSRPSVMPSSTAFALTPPPPALRHTFRRIKTLRSSTQSLLKGFDPSDRGRLTIDHTISNKDIQTIPTSELRLVALGWNKGQEDRVTSASIRNLNKPELLQVCFNARDKLLEAFRKDSTLGCSPFPTPVPKPLSQPSPRTLMLL